MGRGPRPFSRLVRWLPIAVFGLLLAAIVTLGTAFPAVAATSCPRCFGMAEVAPGLYGAPEPTAEQRANLTELVTAARQRVSGFYGEQRSAPTVVACLDSACYQRIGGGGERGVAVLDRAVMLSPRGIDADIVAHEMSHVELHHRMAGIGVPQWFDEGLAVVVADDRRYLAPVGSPDRCLVHPSGPLPRTLPEWLSAASADDGAYAEAACPVSRWVQRYPAPRAAVDALVDGLRAGRPFEDVVSW